MTPLGTGPGVCRVRVKGSKYLPNGWPSPHRVAFSTAQTRTLAVVILPHLLLVSRRYVQYARSTPLAPWASPARLSRGLGESASWYGMSSLFLRVLGHRACGSRHRQSARNAESHTRQVPGIAHTNAKVVGLPWCHEPEPRGLRPGDLPTLVCRGGARWAALIGCVPSMTSSPNPGTFDSLLEGRPFELSL